LADALFGVVKILRSTNEPMSFEDIGYYLTREDPTSKQNEVANKKYGENHAKMAALLDLVLIDKANIRAHITLSEFGTYYALLSNKKQEDISYKLCLRIPIVQNYFLSDHPQDTLEEDLKILSNETQKRRRSNAANVVKWIAEHGGLN